MGAPAEGQLLCMLSLLHANRVATTREAPRPAQPAHGASQESGS